MNRRPVSPPKLSRPRLHEALPRERLFSRLDTLRRHTAIWVAGPPGAGKTSLVAGYVEARAIGGLWYQVDAGDLDPSTFFLYLGEAARRNFPDKPPLPLLTSEYLPDVAGFARRWFRELFSRLEAPALLVFDNYQEAADSLMDLVLCAAIADVPEGVSIVVVSRSAPPTPFARSLAHGEMAMLGWDDLRMTLEETVSLAASRGVSSSDTVRAVQEQCEGWAAGLTLMLERARRADGANLFHDVRSLDTIFDYFAGLAFDALPDASKRDLVLCSYLPSVSPAQAHALTGNPAAGRLLEQFYRRHLFTNRRQDAGEIYEFHALFRTFLRARAASVLGPEQRLAALRDAAGMLLAAGQGSEALALYAGIEDWPSVERAVRAGGAALLAQGRAQTLRDWITLLPDSRVDASPWMQYWLGTALGPHDQQRARATLMRAYECMREADDFAGQAAAAAGVVDTYFFSFSGYAGLREWTERLAGLLDQPQRFSSAEQRLHACTGYLLAAFFGDGGHSDIARHASEIRRLIREPLDPYQRLRAGTILVSYAGAILHPDLVREDVELLDSLAAGTGVAPLHQAQWHQRFGYLCYQLGDYELAEARLTAAERLCVDHGLRAPLSLINQIAVYVLVARGNTQAAMQRVERWERILTADRPVERSQWNVALLVTLMRDEAGRDRWPTLAHEIAAQMDATGQTWIRVANRIPAAYALLECGEHDAVRRWVDELRAMMSGTCFDRFERDVLLIEAALALTNGVHDVAGERLGNALRLSAAADIPLQCAQHPHMLTRLLAFACERGIEAHVARSLAARYRLPIDRADAQFRLRPIEVTLLGRFELRRNGQPMTFKGKPQQRPLGLLKLLAAQGARGAPASFVAEALWPDSEGDLAGNALKVALHRLRALVGNDSAVTSQQGALCLDMHSCWSDVAAFEEAFERAERHRLAGAMPAFEAEARGALALYQGPLLPAEESAPWLLAARDRLTHRARQLILALGTHLELSRRAAEACEVYQSGLAIDSLSEQLYQRLMRAHINLGEHAQAMQAYRRCREMLSIVLGIPPSSESLALFRQAQEQARAVDHP